MPKSVAQVEQQLQDLVLDGDVERGRRLVGEQQLRASWRARWRSSRAGACRRRTGADSRRAGARRPECRRGSSARARGARRARPSSAVWACRFSSICRPTGSTGLSAVIGSWKIMAISRAAHLAQLARPAWPAGRGRCHRHGRSTCARRADQAHDRAQRDALARAGFADQAEDLARRDVEIDAVDGDRHAARRRRRWSSGRAPRGRRRDRHAALID